MKRNFYFETLEYQMGLIREGGDQLLRGLSSDPGRWAFLDTQMHTRAEDSFSISQKMAQALFKEFLPPIDREDLYRLSCSFAALSRELELLCFHISAPTSAFLGRLLPFGRLVSSACENAGQTPLALSAAAADRRQLAHRLTGDAIRLYRRQQGLFSGDDRQGRAFSKHCTRVVQECEGLCTEFLNVAIKNA